MASLPCSDEVHKLVKKYCAEKGIKMKDFVDQAIRYWFEKVG